MINRRRGRELLVEIEAARLDLHEAKADPKMSTQAIEDLREILNCLEHKFFMLGFSSEHDI